MLLVWVGIALPLNSASAQSSDTFSLDVEVAPNPIKVSEFADVTIKALDENWNVNTGESDLDIWIEVEGFDYTDQDVVIPWWGIGFMEASDQWVKIFSKWLTIKKPWTYTLSVVSVYDDSIQWEAEIQVLSDNEWPAQWTITVTSPENDTTLTSDSMDIVWQTNFPNTQLNVRIDWNRVTEWLSDQQGNFSINYSGIQPWSYTLEVNAVDLDDQVIWTSWPIDFNREQASWPLLLDLTVDPNAVVKINEKVTINIETAERVTSALVAVWDDGTMVPTTQTWPGQFQREVSFPEPWNYSVDVQLQVWNESETFEDTEAIVVEDEERRILTLDSTDDVERSRTTLNWTYTWTIDYFKVRYGMDRNNLRLSMTTTQNQANIVIANPTETYYAQVVPVDEDWVDNWEPSDVIQIGPLEEPEPVCGNGIVEAWEECDDGNLVNGDGCNSLCQIEEAEPVCGNGVVEEWEQCDDGNTEDGDGCSATCMVEEPVCGNGILEPGEQCDDGNTENGDGCDETCAIEPEQEAAPESCYTDGIELSTEQINDTYYITREDVPNSREYIVYRADQEVWTLEDMRVVWRVTSARFEYPFDPNAESDKWAWYAVEAVCDETEEQKQVWNIEEVKVWPEHTLLFLIFLLTLWFGWVRLIRGIRYE